MLAKRFPYAVDCLSTAHRQTLVLGFVVACAATFGTVGPKADKQWHEAPEFAFGRHFLPPEWESEPGAEAVFDRRIDRFGLTGKSFPQAACRGWSWLVAGFWSDD